MKKTRFKSAYPEKGKTSFANARNKKGCYIIKKNDQVLYVGMSGSDLYKTISRHFQSWDDPRQVRIVYRQNPAYKLRIVFTNTGRQAAALERALIIKLKPKDNPMKIQMYIGEEKIVEQNWMKYEEAPF